MIQIPTLVLIAIVYILGIIIGTHISISLLFIICYSLILFFFLCISFFKKYTKILHTLLYIFLLLLFIVYTNKYFFITSSNIEKLKDRPVKLTGVIISEPDIRNWQTNLVVKVEKLELSDGKEILPSKCKVLVKVRFQKRDILYGEKYKFSGVLRIPEEGEFKRYLQRENISATINIKERGKIQYVGEGKVNPLVKGALKIKRALINAFSSYISPVYFPVLGGMMLKTGIIPNQIREMFTQIGVVHILSISGLHVVMMSGIFLIILKLFNVPKRISYSIVFILVIFYALITGLGAPIVRSAIMINVFFLGYIIRRKTNILITLSVASLLILLWNPYCLFDIGFQLSFITVLGMAIITPKLEKALKLKPILPVRIFLISIAAWLSSLPLVAYYFGYISWVGPFSNLIIVPLSNLILACGFILLISILVTPFLSYFIEALLNFTVFLLLKISEIMSSWPFAYSKLPIFDLSIILIYYFAVILFLFYPEFKELIRGLKHDNS